MRSHHIVLLAGDGIGPEISSVAKQLLESVSKKHGFKLIVAEHDFGGIAIDKTGSPLPAETLKACQNSDSVLLAAIGNPKFDSLTRETIRTVVDKFIVALQVQLDDKKVHLHIDELAVNWFVENGYNESMGARPMARLIQEKLKKRLAEDILFGSLADNGGDVYVSEHQDNLKVDIKKATSKKDKKEASKTKI